MIKVAVVGARGYVGFELIKLIDKHPKTQLVAAYSREYLGQKVCAIVSGFSDTQLCYCADKLSELSQLELNVVFLALPNNIAAQYQQQWQQMSHNTCIIDLSPDFRFDGDWVYGQPETCSKKIRGQHLIANPGCYATAAQLGLLPLVNVIQENPSVFGVSGYSGAGSKKSDKNNPNKLKDNLMAYQLTNHIHELEISRVLGKEVFFMPHVASFFRGIHLTISVTLKNHMSLVEIKNTFANAYQKDELIHIIDEIPEVIKVQNTPHVYIGGFSIKHKHLVYCVTLDNLLKGAATQAIQNMNLALEMEMNTAIL